MTDLTLALPVGFTGTLRINIEAAVKEPVLTGDDAAACTASGWSNKVDEILGKLEHKDANPHRDVAMYMQGVGFKANPPKKRDGAGDSDKVYVRWEHKASRRVTVYQDKNGLLTDSNRLFAFAKAIAGAVPVAGVHQKVTFFYADSPVDTILAAGKALRDYADSPA